MIKNLTVDDIPQVVKIHKRELPGFLSELGEGFLRKFYEVSLHIPEMFTLIDTEDEQVLGLVSGINSAKGFYMKVISRDIISFVWLFLGNFITHPGNIVKSVKSLTYPGFADDSPEIITIAVKKGYQGKGIGRKLFQESAKEFQKREFKKFRVSTYDKLPANGFYKKMGCSFEKSFEFLGEKMNYYKYEFC